MSQTHKDPRAAILAMADDDEMVPLKGIDGAFVRKLSVADIDALTEAEKNGNIHLLIRCVCAADGAPIFSEADLPALLKMKADRFAPLYKQAADLNGIGSAAAETRLKN
tara:strand:+ start:6301 stop:6627 length:327 start_codon:yes stop_codon:yes gene_type:complete